MLIILILFTCEIFCIGNVFGKIFICGTIENYRDALCILKSL